MSDTQQEGNAGVLPDPETAYQNVFDGVHSQVFFNKLAAAGIEPETEKEAQDLLMLAGRLRTVEAAEKQAGDGEGRFGGALTALDSVLGETGMDGQIKQAAAQEEAIAIKQTAAAVMQDPTIYNSVLSLKAHEAAAIAEQFGGQPTG